MSPISFLINILFLSKS